jgi:hypothetical protein
LMGFLWVSPTMSAWVSSIHLWRISRVYFPLIISIRADINYCFVLCSTFYWFASESLPFRCASIYNKRTYKLSTIFIAFQWVSIKTFDSGMA